MRPVTSLFTYASLLSFAAVVCNTGAAMAQPTLDNFLSGVDVTASKGCNAIEIRLNRPASYLSHFPTDTGDGLTIKLEPLAVMLPGNNDLDQKEAGSVAPDNPAGLTSVSFDPFATGGPVIRLFFARTTAFRVVMDKDTRLLHIDASSLADAARCIGKSAVAGSGEPKTDQSAKSDGPAPSAPAADDAAGALKEGKAILSGGDAQRAALFFTKAVTIGSGKVKQDAQEMLGLARERAGQLAHAKAEYETYLKLYPKGEDALRVRGRLDGVLASMDEAAQKQFASQQLKRGGGAAADAKQPANVSLPEAQGGPVLADGKGSLPGLQITKGGTKLNFKEVEKDPNAWTWEKNGSIGQYYYRDDNFSPSDVSSGSLDRHEEYQNETISSGDVYVSGENQNYRVDFRSSVYNEFGLGSQRDQRDTNVGTLYAEGLAKGTGASVRLGRQSKSTGGVFGRFDGGLAGWQVSKSTKLQAYAGSPVYSRAAKPFAEGRYLYGASIDYTFPSEAWAGALYLMEQDIKSVVDRRAVGAELRYAGKNKSIYSAADYDIFYKELNNAYVTGTWNLTEGSSLYATADFRRVPFLLTSNALMGQNETQLSSLVEIFGENEVDELAVDRTATAKTVSLGATRQISKDWQISVDGTVADYSGTPASGGVDEIPDPGIEYYASAQLTGTNLFKENDVVTFGLRYSNSENSDLYMFDAFLRYPFNDKLRINPRLRLSRRDFKIQDRIQYLVMPSIGARYRLSKSWNFEMEVGARWEHNLSVDGAADNLDLLATAGYRYEF